MYSIGVDFHKAEAVHAFVAPYRDDAQAVLEATRNWTVMYDMLEKELRAVYLAHPLKVRAIAEAWKSAGWCQSRGPPGRRRSVRRRALLLSSSAPWHIGKVHAGNSPFKRGEVHKPNGCIRQLPKDSRTAAALSTRRGTILFCEELFKKGER